MDNPSWKNEYSNPFRFYPTQPYPNKIFKRTFPGHDRTFSETKEPWSLPAATPVFTLVAFVFIRIVCPSRVLVLATIKRNNWTDIKVAVKIWEMCRGTRSTHLLERQAIILIRMCALCYIWCLLYKFVLSQFRVFIILFLWIFIILFCMLGLYFICLT